jgi:hypothetical protein
MMHDPLDLELQAMPVDAWLPYFVRRIQDAIFSPEDVFGILTEIWKSSPEANEDDIQKAYYRWKAARIHSEEQ